MREIIASGKTVEEATGLTVKQVNVFVDGMKTE